MNRFVRGVLQAAAVLAAITSVFMRPDAASAQTLPTGFTETIVWSGLTQPIAVRFAPDGRVFVAEKGGVIKVFNGVTDTTPTVFADLSPQVHNFWDRGLISIALHPSFPTTPYVYALYTFDAGRWGDACPTPPGPNTDGCVVHGRLSRLQAQGDVMVPGSEQVLIQDWCQQYPSHSVGDLAFGPDGALYVSGGDGASFTFVDYGQEGQPPNPCGDPPSPAGTALSPPTAEGGALRSQDLRTSGDPVSLDGAVLRVDPITGAGLPSNPLASSTDPNARRIIAYGLRNPFRFAIRPATSELWVGDVGWNDWEEINRITSTTDANVENFGWPCYEGQPRQGGYDAANLSICENLYASPGAVTGPYFAYHHTARVVPGETCPTGTSSVTGQAFAFYSGGPYPAEYDGALFFSDYARDCIWAMRAGTSGLPAPGLLRTFVAGAANPVDIQISPSGELFYVDLDGGTIRRIVHNAAPPPPTGEEKAAGRPTSASSILAPHTPNLAVDRVPTTRWSSAYADNQWWQVDLGSARSVDAVRVDWEAAYATRYQILTSLDGSNFSLAAEQTAMSAASLTTRFTARDARYVRVLGVTRGSPWGFSFWEAFVYGPPDVSPPPTGEEKAAGRPTSASSILSPHTPNLAVDRMPTTRWSSIYADNQWWQVDLGSARSVDTVRVDWEAAYATRYQILTSLDGTNFSLAAEQTATSAASLTTRFTARNARYVRVQGVTRGSPWGFSFWEAFVYGPPDSGNTAPVPTIASPVAGTTWQVGETLTFSGSATDAQDGALPAANLSWSLLLQHCPSSCHTHALQDFNGVASGSFVAPDHDYPSYLELRLTARDSAGATATTTRRLDPKTALLSFRTVPTGLQLTVGSSTAQTPFDRTVILGSTNSLSAPSPQTAAGTTYLFSSWSDGGAQTHNVVANGPATYTATFAASGGAAPVNTELPVISGTAQQGSQLTASQGTWSGTQPMTFAYQWLRCASGSISSCGAIQGATAAAYTATATDIGNRLRVRVTATNNAGSAAAVSNAFGPIRRMR